MRKKATAVFISLVYLFGNVIAANAAQSNLWSERQKFHVTGQTSAQLAGVPGSVPRVASPSAIMTGIPAISKTLDRLHLMPSRILESIPSQIRTILAAIPTNAGKVRSVYSVPNSQRLIVLVQDVHMNHEAQSNIAGILKALGLGVAVEGASGPFDFAWFHQFSDQSIIRAVADAFVDQNRISAASYVGLTTPSIPGLIGIDDNEHYQANVQAYVTAVASQSGTIHRLERLQARVRNQKRAVLNPELSEFDQQRNSYESGAMSFGEYVTSLSRRAELHMSGDNELVVDQFLAAYQIEKKLDLPLIEQQRKRVVGKLANSLSDDELNEFVAAGVAYQADQLGYSNYYRLVRDLIERHHIQLSEFPAFDGYIRYVLLADAIDTNKLMPAVLRLETQVMKSLCTTKKEWQLMAASHALFLQSRLVRFELTPEEWAEYKTLPTSQTMKASLNDFENFYREADIRSEKMVANILGQHTLGNQVAMVVGGFHTPYITALLKQRHVSFAVIQPQISKVENELGASYLSVFSKEKAPLEKIFQGEKLFLAVSSQLAGNSAGDSVTKLMTGSAKAILHPALEQPVFDEIYATTEEPTWKEKDFGEINIPFGNITWHVHFVRRWSDAVQVLLKWAVKKIRVKTSVSEHISGAATTSTSIRSARLFLMTRFNWIAPDWFIKLFVAPYYWDDIAGSYIFVPLWLGQLFSSEENFSRERTSGEKLITAAGILFVWMLSVSTPLAVMILLMPLTSLLVVPAMIVTSLLANISARFLWTAALMGLRYRGPPAFNFKLSNQEIRYISSFAYIQSEIERGHAADDLIFDNAAKFLTTHPQYPFPPMDRTLIDQYLLAVKNPDFPIWKELVSAKIADVSLRHAYFDEGLSSIAALIEHRHKELEVLYHESREAMPVAPPSIFTDRFGIFSAEQRYPHAAEGQNSEDFGLNPVMSDGSFFSITLDGMGGHSHGDQAARFVAAAFHQFMRNAWVQHHATPEKWNDPQFLRDLLHEAAAFAEAKLNASPVFGNTYAGVVVNAKVGAPLGNGRYRVVAMNVGDARAYLIRRGQPIMNLSKDNFHLIDLQTLPEFQTELDSNFRFLQSFAGSVDDIRHDGLRKIWEHRNKLSAQIMEGLYRFLGVSFVTFDTEPGDIVLSMTDGGSDSLTLAQIAKLRFSVADPHAALQLLVSRAQPKHPKNSRAKPDDVRLDEIHLNQFTPLENSEKEQIDSLHGELDHISSAVLGGDIESAQSSLEVLQQRFDGAVFSDRSHPAIKGFSDLLLAYREIVRVLPVFFEPGEALIHNDQFVGTVLHDGRDDGPESIFQNKLVLISTAGDRLIVLDRDDVMRQFGNQYTRRAEFDFAMVHEPARQFFKHIDDAAKQGASTSLLTSVEYNYPELKPKEGQKKTFERLIQLLPAVTSAGILAGKFTTLDDLQNAIVLQQQAQRLGIHFDDNISREQMELAIVKRSLGSVGTVFIPANDRLRYMVLRNEDKNGQNFFKDRILFFDLVTRSIAPVPYREVISWLQHEDNKAPSEPDAAAQALAGIAYTAVQRTADVIAESTKDRDAFEQALFNEIDDRPLDELGPGSLTTRWAYNGTNRVLGWLLPEVAVDAVASLVVAPILEFPLLLAAYISDVAGAFFVNSHDEPRERIERLIRQSFWTSLVACCVLAFIFTIYSEPRNPVTDLVRIFLKSFITGHMAGHFFVNLADFLYRTSVRYGAAFEYQMTTEHGLIFPPQLAMLRHDQGELPPASQPIGEKEINQFREWIRSYPPQGKDQIDVRAEIAKIVACVATNQLRYLNNSWTFTTIEEKLTDASVREYLQMMRDPSLVSFHLSQFLGKEAVTNIQGSLERDVYLANAFENLDETRPGLATLIGYITSVFLTDGHWNDFSGDSSFKNKLRLARSALNLKVEAVAEQDTTDGQLLDDSATVDRLIHDVQSQLFSTAGDGTLGIENVAHLANTADEIKDILNNKIERRSSHSSIKATVDAKTGKIKLTITDESAIEPGQQERFRSFVAGVELILNILFAKSPNRERMLKNQAEKMVLRISDDYHDFKDVSVASLLSSRRYARGVRDFYLKHPEVLARYIDDDFLSDIVYELGNKSSSPRLHDTIHEYLSFVHLFETAHSVTQMKLALIGLLKTYRFSKVLEAGRVKLWLQKASRHPWRFDEEHPIANLDPTESEFIPVGAAQSVDSVAEFETYVGRQIAINPQNKTNLYIYERLFTLGRRPTAVIIRDGRRELHYASNTYSEVAGLLRMQRLEGAMGYIDSKDGLFKANWYMKPDPPQVHEWSNLASLKINQLLAAGALHVEPENEADTKMLRGLFVDWGLAYGPNGFLISRDGPELRYGNKLGLRFDPRRYPNALNIALGLVGRVVNGGQQIEELNNAYQIRGKHFIQAVAVDEPFKIKAARGLTLPRTLRWGRAIGLSDTVTRFSLALVVEFHRFYGNAGRFAEDHNEDGTLTSSDLLELNTGIQLVRMLSLLLPLVVFSFAVSFGGHVEETKLIVAMVGSFVLGNLLGHASLNAYLLSRISTEQKMLTILRPLPHQKYIPRQVFMREILPLVTPAAEKIGVKDAVTVRASEFLTGSLMSEQPVTRASLASAVPLLLYLQRDGKRAVSVDALERDENNRLHSKRVAAEDADMQKRITPRLEISGAKNDYEAQELIATTLRQTQLTKGTVVLAFSSDVLEKLKLTRDQITSYSRNGVRLTSHYRVPSDISTLALLFGVETRDMKNVNVVVSRRVQSDSLVLGRLSRLTTAPDVKVNLFILVDELFARFAVPMTMRELTDMARFSRVLATQA